eukprot:547211_1
MAFLAGIAFTVPFAIFAPAATYPITTPHTHPGGPPITYPIPIPTPMPVEFKNRKNRRRSNHDKHTKPRAGGSSQKQGGRKPVSPGQESYIKPKYRKKTKK